MYLKSKPSEGHRLSHWKMYCSPHIGAATKSQSRVGARSSEKLIELYKKTRCSMARHTAQPGCWTTFLSTGRDPDAYCVTARAGVDLERWAVNRMRPVYFQPRYWDG